MLKRSYKKKASYPRNFGGATAKFATRRLVTNQSFSQWLFCNKFVVMAWKKFIILFRKMEKSYNWICFGDKQTGEIHLGLGLGLRPYQNWEWEGKHCIHPITFSENNGQYLANEVKKLKILINSKIARIIKIQKYRNQERVKRPEKTKSRSVEKIADD